MSLGVSTGASDEADEGAAGEEQDERVSAEPRNRLLEERPAAPGGEPLSRRHGPF